MFKGCYNTPDRCIKTGYALRPLYSELAPFGICTWFAMYYIIKGKSITSLDDLEDIEKRLPYPNGFRYGGRLGGLMESEYTYVLKLHGFVVKDVLQMKTTSENIEILGIMLKRLLWNDGLKQGTKLLLEVDKVHAIAVKILPGGKMVLVDQVTSCFLDEMRDNERFGW
jgi:hypothetical protein